MPGSSSSNGNSGSDIERNMMSDEVLACPEKARNVTQLPGYVEIPESCPTWKKAMLEKKNAELAEAAKAQIQDRMQEEEKWKNVPAWKKNLIKDKEKKKYEEMAGTEDERKAREEEMARLEAMPAWKRDLVMKKRGDQS